MVRRGLVAMSAGVVVGIGLAACTPQSSDEALTMRLTSSAFTDGGSIPAQYTCDGDNVSPPLAWDDPPPGTASFALIVTDPDAGGFVHWVLRGIPPNVRDLPDGGGDSVGTPGSNDFGRSGWGGPCPPSGEHRYVFELFAVGKVEIGSGVAMNAAALRQAIADNVLARGELTGVYRRRKPPLHWRPCPSAASTSCWCAT